MAEAVPVLHLLVQSLHELPCGVDAKAWWYPIRLQTLNPPWCCLLRSMCCVCPHTPGMLRLPAWAHRVRPCPQSVELPKCQSTATATATAGRRIFLQHPVLACDPVWAAPPQVLSLISVSFRPDTSGHWLCHHSFPAEFTLSG